MGLTREVCSCQHPCPHCSVCVMLVLCQTYSVSFVGVLLVPWPVPMTTTYRPGFWGSAREGAYTCAGWSWPTASEKYSCASYSCMRRSCKAKLDVWGHHSSAKPRRLTRWLSCVGIFAVKTAPALAGDADAINSPSCLEGLVLPCIQYALLSLMFATSWLSELTAYGPTWSQTRMFPSCGYVDSLG